MNFKLSNNMNATLSNKRLHAFFIVIITCLYVMVFENGLCGSIDCSNASNPADTEFVAQPELFKSLGNKTDRLSPKPHNAYQTFYYATIHHYRKQLLSIRNFGSRYILRASIVPVTVHPIISILHKSNTWHHASDEDPLLRIS